MFGDYSVREILLWIGGMLVAAAKVIFGPDVAVDAGPKAKRVKRASGRLPSDRPRESAMILHQAA
jgi:hypothetical protein